MKHNKKHVIGTICLPILWLLTNFISKYPNLIETYYSIKIYPSISIILRKGLGGLSFSVGDALMIFVIILCIRKIVLILKNKGKTIVNDLLHFGYLLSILYCCFYLFWGLNYFREPLAQKLNLKTSSSYSTETLIHTTKLVIDKLNSIHCELSNENDSIKIEVPFSNKELFKKALKGYEILANEHKSFTYSNPSIKNSLISILQSYNGVSGYINPLTGEAQINAIIPKTGMPATICHEMAHQIGWNAENEANFIGFLTASKNPDKYFKYSAYRMAFRYLIVEVNKRDKTLYKNLWKTVNKGIGKDFNHTHKHWQKFRNPIEPYIKKGYNFFLKANNQEKGIDSYDYVVDLLIGYFNENS